LVEKLWKLDEEDNMIASYLTAATSRGSRLDRMSIVQTSLARAGDCDGRPGGALFCSWDEDV